RVVGPGQEVRAPGGRRRGLRGAQRRRPGGRPRPQARGVDPGMTAKASGLRIGEVAQRAEVSARTLRYYEELGLLSPAGKTAGGARRYDDRDVEQLLRIRELQEVMGFNLDEIAVILQSERRL